MNIIRVGTTTVGNIILVTTDSGATVYAVSGGKVVSGVAVGGVAKLKVKAGIWRVWAELNGETTSEVEVIVTDSYYKEMSFAIPLSSLAEGALVQINESGSPVPFYLATYNYESDLNGAGRVLFVRKDCYNQKMVWHSSQRNDYANSDISNWLNGTYKSLLDSSIQSLMGTTKFMYNYQASASVGTLARSVFLLSGYECNAKGYYEPQVGDILPTASLLKVAYVNGTAVSWWLRTARRDNSVEANHMQQYAGTNSSHIVTDNMQQYPRPCFTLPVDSLMVSGSPNADGSYTLIV